MNINPYLILGVSFILVCILYLSIVVLWVYQSRKETVTGSFKNKITQMLTNAMQLTGRKGEKAFNSLASFVSSKPIRIETFIKLVLEYDEGYVIGRHEFFMRLYERSGVINYIIKGLSSNNKFIISTCCRYVGDLHITGMEARLLSLIEYTDDDIIYNILLSFSRLGYGEGIKIILTEHEGKLNLSNRAIVEILAAYSGSKEELLKEIIDLCNIYIKSIIIKAAVNYRFNGMKEYYLRYLKSDDKNLRIACIRALGGLQSSSNENYLATMLFDKEWEVRAAAAKELELIGTPRSFSALEKAASDSQWWVRNNAANTLVRIPGGRQYAAKIISGADEYARDAINRALEVYTKDSIFK
jgi:hypothetical protein